MGAHGGQSIAGQVGGGRCQFAQLDVEGTRQVPGFELGVLSDVEYRTGYRRGVDEGHVGDRMAGLCPGVDAAVELAGEALVADAERLAHHLGPVLGWVLQDDQRDVVGDQPAQPAGELWAERDRERARNVCGGEGLG